MGDVLLKSLTFFSILINRDNFGRHGNQDIVTFQNVLVLALNKILYGMHHILTVYILVLLLRDY